MTFKELDHCEIKTNHFFLLAKKSFEPFRIRDKRSHTRPKSCSWKFELLLNKRSEMLRNAYLLGGFSMTYHSILNFSNTPTLYPLMREKWQIKGEKIK